MLLGFIPSAITRDSPHVLRSIFVLPVPMILTGIGCSWFEEKFKNSSMFKGKLITIILIISVIVSFFKWYKDYLNIYPSAYSWAWQYGYSDAAAFVLKEYSNYDKIIFTKRYGEPHEFLLFYLKIDPKRYQKKENVKWDYHSGWYWVDSFDKFEFLNDWEIPYKAKCESGQKCLLFTSPGKYNLRWEKVKTINYSDGKPVFDILKNK